VRKTRWSYLNTDSGDYSSPFPTLQHTQSVCTSRFNNTPQPCLFTNCSPYKTPSLRTSHTLHKTSPLPKQASKAQLQEHFHKSYLTSPFSTMSFNPYANTFNTLDAFPPTPLTTLSPASPTITAPTPTTVRSPTSDL
jgi:hypothetical protein